MASDSFCPLMVNDAPAGAGTAAAQWLGGRGVFYVKATFGGGSVKLQQKTPDGTFVDVPATVNATVPSLTANGMCAFELPPGELRVAVATATGVYAYAVGTRVD